MSATELFPRGMVIPEFDDSRDIQIVRTGPRIGLHRLAQYVHAVPPSERRSLLYDEKYPSPFRVSYAPVERAFAEALRLDWNEDTLFTRATRRWWEHKLTNAMALRRRELCVDALVECCLMLEGIQERLARLGARPVVSSVLWQPRVIGTVRIASRPVLRLERTRRGVREVGAVSFQMCKTHAHSRRAAELAAVLLAELAEGQRPSRGERFAVAPTLCLVIDVQSGLVVNADRGRVLRLLQAALACDEIAGRWSEL